MHSFEKGDALILVDMQNDFLPGGSLAAPSGDTILPTFNRYLALASRASAPVFATRDFHPHDHCSFREQGGPWPPHCVQGTPGAELSAKLNLPGDLRTVDKGTDPKQEAYSGFEGTNLHESLKALGVDRLWVGGIATEYCVLQTTRDAIRLGYRILLLEDAIRAIDAKDGARALEEMRELGAISIDIEGVRA